MKNNIRYPRRRIVRGILRTLGRIILPMGFKLTISGVENFPKAGPLLVVGNHIAVMESVMMTLLTPWQVEMIGSIDLPHEKLSEIAIRLWGCIPIRRGRLERQAMSQAIEVLAQGGILGLFPEGGVWDIGAMRAQTGIAWLSYHSGAPVLPIGFSGTLGALDQAIRFQRPELRMNIGKPIPPARLPEGVARKVFFESYASEVMTTIRKLLPDTERDAKDDMINERFKLQVCLKNTDNEETPIPIDLSIAHSDALAKLLHRPVILKIFHSNLDLPVSALQDLSQLPSPIQIATACRAILDYLENENPYFLSYRFGPRQAEAMKMGITELDRLATWADESGFSIQVTPVRTYYSRTYDREIVQTFQDIYDRWR